MLTFNNSRSFIGAMLTVLLVGSATSPLTEGAYPGINGDIIFTSRRANGFINIFTMTPVGASQVRLSTVAQGEFQPNYSSDGTRISFTRSFVTDTRIYTMNADASQQTALTTPGAFDTTPVWSPSGAFIAFARNSGAGSEIWVMTSNGAIQFQLTFNASSFDVAWSPDGTRLAFTRDNPGQDQDIIVLTLFPLTETNVTDLSPFDDRAADWSPDGSQLTFTSDRDGDFEVYVMDADGSNVVPVTDEDGFDNVPSWSPDGTLIAFASDRDEGLSDIYIKSADGSGVATRLTFTGDNSQPSWQPVPAVTATQAIRADVSSLVAAGTLNHGNANALDSKLRHAIEKMDQLNVQPAANMLNAFINQVNAFLNAGKLSLEEGQPLIDAARTVIDFLDSGLLVATPRPELELP